MVSPLMSRSSAAPNALRVNGNRFVLACTAVAAFRKAGCATGHLPSALVRSLHNFHGVFDMTPFARFLGLALALARQSILCRLGNRRRAMPLEHLPRDGVDLHLRSHVALPQFQWIWPPEQVRLVLKTAEPAARSASFEFPRR
jgi:hypothetical protein